MPATGHAALRFAPPQGRYWIEGTVTVVDRQDKLALRDVADTSRIPPGGTPGYTVFSARGGVRVDPRWELTAAVENLTNRNYRIHGSGQNEAGTNFVVSLQTKF